MSEVTKKRLREIARQVRILEFGDPNGFLTDEGELLAVLVAERAVAEQKAHDRELVCVNCGRDLSTAGCDMTGDLEEPHLTQRVHGFPITRAEHESRRERGRT